MRLHHLQSRNLSFPNPPANLAAAPVALTLRYNILNAGTGTSVGIQPIGGLLGRK